MRWTLEGRQFLPQESLLIERTPLGTRMNRFARGESRIRTDGRHSLVESQLRHDNRSCLTRRTKGGYRRVAKSPPAKCRVPGWASRPHSACYREVTEEVVFEGGTRSQSQCPIQTSQASYLGGGSRCPMIRLPGNCCLLGYGGRSDQETCGGADNRRSHDGISHHPTSKPGPISFGEKSGCAACFIDKMPRHVVICGSGSARDPERVLTEV